MASIYKRPGSDFWWIKFRDPTRPVFDKDNKQQPRRESTGFRHDNSVETRKARDLCEQRSKAEQAVESSNGLREQQWELWVPQFIQSQTTAKTSERYMTAWRTLRIFLQEHNILIPRQLSYTHCTKYLPWRAVPDKANGKYNAGRNTAILEFKLLRWLMREAVRREYCQGNPAREVGVKREPAKKPCDFSARKSRVSPADIAAAIETEPEPFRTQMRRCFLVARYHGVRLNETNVNPTRDVRIWEEPQPDKTKLKVGEITFHQKGGKVREKPLHPRLIPLFEELITSRATHTYQPIHWGNRWTKFFQRHKFKELEPRACHHSLRVMVQNVLRRAGIPKEIRKAYLSHESTDDVNEEYDRIEVDEMRVCHAPLDF